MRGFLVALLVLAPALASADPTVSDQAAAKQLLGHHLLTLQWLGFGDLRTAGTADVVAKDGRWHLTGRQEAKQGVVELDGEVVAIDKSTFVFEGNVMTRVEGNNNDQPCERNGRYTFLKKPGKKYWRLQPIDNPCDQVADYIDIYLR
ncbi:MAG TPA: hypothetical protein VMT54_20645 [Candidatus Cybelea sp.]|nr:hypothetical protein [Candidatus Cybelea sp.]